MQFEVILEAPVQEELDSTYALIARDSQKAAAKWYEGCVAAMASLAQVPSRCPLAPECDHFDVEIRHLIRGNYRILFTIRGARVHVLHVRHAARRPL